MVDARLDPRVSLRSPEDDDFFCAKRVADKQKRTVSIAQGAQWRSF
ncbi:MAG: hypothetical protein ACTSV1_07485 [Alphaproteobacteria bacterium]